MVLLSVQALLVVVCCSHLSSSHVRRELDPLRGTYHAWWVIMGIEKDNVRQMVQATNSLKDIDLAPSTKMPGWSEIYHPVVMEIGEEFDCGPVGIKALRSNFMEYKFDIPFITSKTNASKLFTYKQVLYENNRMDSTSSKLFYKLNASFAEITKSDGSYNITIADGILTSTFESNSTWTATKNLPNLKNYQEIMDQPWFGGKGLETCARHNYDFDNAMARPAFVKSLNFSPSLLNDYFPAYRYSVYPLSDKYPFGAVEVRINFTMSVPMDCDKV